MDRLGTGIFTVAEAAEYASVPTSLMSRWLFAKNEKKRVFVPEYGAKDKIVSFLDWVQAVAIREIRKQHKVPLIKFREAIHYAETKYGLKTPFARKHTTFFNKTTGELSIIPPDHKDVFIQASGKQKGQCLIPCIEVYLEDIEFANDGIAKAHSVYKYYGSGPEPIVIKIDPQKRFGEPLLPSGHSAFTIASSVIIEGGTREAAEAYGLHLDEVEAAYRYKNSLQGRIAA